MWIGFTGVALAGKDTAAAKLVKSTFMRYAFADRLKQVCSLLYGDEILDPKKKDVPIKGIGKSPRAIFQDIGELFRSYDPDFWVKQVARFTDSRVDYDIVFSDIRYDNEADYVAGNGGFIIRIERTVEKVRHHVSEAGISDRYVSYTIHNSSTIQYLEEAVDRVVLDLRSRRRNYASESGTLANRLDKLNGSEEKMDERLEKLDMTMGQLLERLSFLEDRLGVGESNENVGNAC